MKTPRFQLTVRAVAAAAVALAGSFSAVPALAESGIPAPVPAAAATTATETATAAATASGVASPAGPAVAGPAAAGPATPAASVAPEISDAGLAEAVRRDLGMTLEEFNAAGQLARTAADAVPSLRDLPGYVGISLQDGRIRIEGSGAELQARITELNRLGAAAVFELSAPAAAAPATADAAPGASPASADPTAPSADPETDPSATFSDTPSADPVASPAADPARVPSAAELVAANTDQLFQSYVRDVGPAGLQAVAYSGGRFVIRTGGTNAAEADATTAEAAAPADAPAAATPAPAAATPVPAAATQVPAKATPVPAQATASPAAAPGKVSPADFVARYANVQLEQGSPAGTEADVYGGEGYAVDRRTVCSAGFGAFSAAGLPVVLTAGHCAEDGKALVAELEPPTSATAGGSAPRTGALLPLGRFGFSQFGGPLNSWITGTEDAPGNVGTDIALIEGLDGGLDLQPAATTWADPANPAATAVKIIGTVAPFQGQEVCRSGRTAGWSCGQVEETGIYVVGGRTTAATDLRAFRGFLSRNVQSSGGDSGGPWISGNFAVGTHSAGETSGENFAIATTLEDALTKIPTAVQLQLFLNKPGIVGPEAAPVAAGDLIRGRVPSPAGSPRAADSKVRITVAGHQPLEVPVDSTGNWSFVAPFPVGPLSFSAETVHGFSRSGAVQFKAAVAPSALAAPVVTSPAEGDAVKQPVAIGGTGAPGARVVLSGDAAGSADVGLDGQWSLPAEGSGYGRLTVNAVQTAGGVADGPTATRNFTVTPPAPTVSSLVNGTHFSEDSLPETISGTGIDGADIAVHIDGTSAATTKAIDGPAGQWSVPFPAGLAVGTHMLSVSQSVDGISSEPLLTTFTIDALAVAPPVFDSPAPAPAAPLPPIQAPVFPAGSGELPDTGAGSLLPTAGLAGGAIVLGGVLLGAGRRRLAG